MNARSVRRSAPERHRYLIDHTPPSICSAPSSSSVKISVSRDERSLRQAAISTIQLRTETVQNRCGSSVNLKNRTLFLRSAYISRSVKRAALNEYSGVRNRWAGSSTEQKSAFL